MLSWILDFQKIQLKIMGLGINRKVLNIQESDDTFMVVNSSRNTYFFLLFFGMLSVFLLSGFIIQLQGKNITTESVIVGFIIHPLFGAIGLRKFLWMLRGKEVLKINEGRLTIEKTGTFWTRKKEFILDDIKNVRTKYETKRFISQPKKLAKNWLAIKELRRVFLSFTIGEIEFDYNGNVVRLFNDLNDNERETLKEKIKGYLPQNTTA